MKSSKSINSLANHQQQQQLQEHSDSNSNDTNATSVARRPQPVPPPTSSTAANSSNSGAGAPTSPICRCRVMYLGSSVPHITKDGLQGIQEPLRELYPDPASLASGNAGIDSWLSVWSNGILVENVDETGRQVKRFFKIEALHYCAAVKYVPQAASPQQQVSNGTTNGDNIQNFLPLDSPHARMQANTNPPIFASILRRTTGVKVLECHAFICKREAAANALVRCCFHAYADTMYAKQIGADVDKLSSDLNNNSSTMKSSQTIGPRLANGTRSIINGAAPAIVARRSKSIANLNDQSNSDREYNFSGDDSDFHNLNNNGGNYATMRPRISPNDSYIHMNGDLKHQQQKMQHINPENLARQQKFSKSMHHLDQYQDQFNQIYSRPGDINDGRMPSNLNQSTSYHNLSRQHSTQITNQPFYNPLASRVPSYPPQNLIDQQQSTNAGGTMRSIKSVTGNSIASTLLRSKKHAKAMSMAQINHSKQQDKNSVISFHQPQSNASLRGGNSFILPPVPPMFLPNLPHPILNGSQTMKIPSRAMAHPLAGQPMNFEAMTPKEMKKLLKKSAKYGIDPTKFGDNGLPLFPLRPIPPPPQQLPLHMQQAFMPPPPPMPINKSGTFSGHSLLSMDINQLNGGGIDIQDYHHGLPPPPPQMMLPPPAMMGPMGPAFPHELSDQQAQGPIKSILVKPNPEFLKSKAGKKWLKQQKEFKKLLPPHLDGLPIVFGPPPMDALEPASVSDVNAMHSPASHQQQQHPPPPPFVSPPLPGLPMMDSSGYYNPHPFYGPSGRASAASTLMRYSPRSQNFHQESHYIAGPHGGANQAEYLERGNSLYGNNMKPAMSMNQLMRHQQQQQRQDFNGDNSSLVYGNTELRVPESRQFQFNGNEQHLRHKQRNHMIEQRVISLGDENDAEDDDGQMNGHDEDDDDDDESGKATGYYHQVGQSHSGSSRSSRNPDSRLRKNEHIMQQHEHHNSQQQDYEQVMPPNDDQSSYSSGIYKRGHINERAFSYSIQQEHRTSASNSDIDYASGDRSQPQHQTTYDSPNIQNDMFRNRGHERSVDHYSNEQQSVNHLAARVESQLNFADSRIKPHI